MKSNHKKPQILHVTRQFHPAIGGIENVVYNISIESIKKGYKVTVLTLNRNFNHNELLPAEDEIDGIQIIRIPFFGSSRYAIAPSVLKVAYDFDIIHIHSSDFFLDFLAFTKFIHKKKLVLHSHGLYFHTNFVQIFKKLYFHTITSISGNQMDAVLCVSKKDWELLEKIIPSKKLFLIPNGINDRFYSQPQTNNRDPNLMISVGRLSTNKRYDVLIKFFAEIIKDAPEMTLYIIGKDFGELSNIEALIYKLKIQSNIRIMGEISDVELKNCLKKAKFWISTSEYESFGVALLEAMASGCIPIISDIPAYNELVEDKINGFILNFNDLQQSTYIFHEVLQSSDEIFEKIKNLNSKKVEYFRWSSIVDKITNIYEDLFEIPLSTKI
jgi:alpha-1,3-mannosyltransferase